MIGLLVSLFVLSLLIFVHELGHLLAAKKGGVKVEEFGFGYPPRLVGIKKGETVYSLNLIPFGGFTRIDEDAFAKKEKRIRGPVLLAGIAMNFLLAIFLFSLIYGFLGIPQKQGYVKVIAVAEGSPAAQAGLREGDVIDELKIKNEKFKIGTNSEFVKLVNDHLGQEIELIIKRGGESLTVTLTPRHEPPEGEGPLGVAISDSQLVKPALWQRPFLSLWWGTKEAFAWLATIFFGIVQMINKLIFQRVFPQDISGPVGIVQITGQVVRRGVFALLQFIAALSVNLAVLNLLPIPALDGGRLLFLGAEIVTGKKPKPKWEKRIHTLGMILLLFLMLAITVQDLSRLFPVLNGFF